MQKKAILVIFFLANCINAIYSQNIYEGNFQFTIIITNPSLVHFNIIITYYPPSSGWDHSYESIPRSLGVKDFKAYDYTTKKNLKVTSSFRDIYVDFKIDFGKKITSPEYKFVIEFDATSAIKKESSDEYSLKWGWGHFEKKILQNYTVKLPPNHELIKTEYTLPNEVERTGNIISLIYAGESPRGGFFTWKIFFSNKGYLYLQQAQNYINIKDFSNAEKYFELSETFYEKTGNNNKITEIQTQLEKIRGTTGKISEANALFAQAEAYFVSNNYENATLYYQKAKRIYDELKEKSKSQLVDDMIKKVNDTIGNEADAFLEEGRKEFNNGNYELAYQKFYSAREKFSMIEDEMKIMECDNWISRISKTRESEKNKRNIMIYGGISIFCFIFIIFFTKTNFMRGIPRRILINLKTKEKDEIKPIPTPLDTEESKAVAIKEMPLRLPESAIVFSGYTFLLAGFFLLGILEPISFVLGIILLLRTTEKNKTHALIISYNSFVLFVFYLAGVMGWF